MSVSAVTDGPQGCRCAGLGVGSSEHGRGDGLIHAGVAAPSRAGLGPEIAAVFACAIAYCGFGYGLRRGSRVAIWLAIVFTALVSLGAALILMRERRAGVIIALVFNQTLFWLVIVGFTRLVASERGDVGA